MEINVTVISEVEEVLAREAVDFAVLDDVTAKDWAKRIRAEFCQPRIGAGMWDGLCSGKSRNADDYYMEAARVFSRIPGLVVFLIDDVYRWTALLVADAGALGKAIIELHSFEWYLVDVDLRLLVCSTDHACILISAGPTGSCGSSELQAVYDELEWRRFGAG